MSKESKNPFNKGDEVTIIAETEDLRRHCVRGLNKGDKVTFMHIYRHNKEYGVFSHEVECEIKNKKATRTNRIRLDFVKK